MQKLIKIKDKEIEYSLRINRRSKSIRLAVHPLGKVIVTAPSFIPHFLINKFLMDKSDWLIKKIEQFSKIKPTKNKKEQKEEYLKYKNKAMELVIERLEYFNKFYNLKWNRITIRNQKTRWGSCSRKGNLNFNYKIVLLPTNQADYIIVHELCHLKEMNHRKEFWNMVGQTIPEYKHLRRELKDSKLALS